MTASPPSDRPARLRLSRRAWWLIAGGFALGLLLFLALWWDMRTSGDFYRAPGKSPTDDGQVFEPLPAPTSDGSRSASGLDEAAEAARTARASAPPVPAPRPVETAPVPQRVPTPDTHTDGLAPGRDPVPIAKVQPDYPAEAIRNSESGKVVVRIEVGPDGVPSDVSIARSSRSRVLDRAAMQAARRWRFRAAQENGRAVAGWVEVPFQFNLDER